MTRVTIQDDEKTVSFGGDEWLARCLMAACAAEPRTVEDLLLAVEPFDTGTTARVVHGLLAFDAARERAQAPAHLGDGAETAWEPRRLPAVEAVEVVEVVDEATSYLARTPDDEGLLRIDLRQRAIGGQVASTQPLTARGTLHVTSPTGLEYEVAFVLGAHWTVDLATMPQEDAMAPQEVAIAPRGRATMAQGERDRGEASRV